MLDFLNALVAARADLLAGRQLFVTGESYGEFSCALGRPVEAENILETN
jgi:hypothetical protein